MAEADRRPGRFHYPPPSAPVQVALPLAGGARAEAASVVARVRAALAPRLREPFRLEEVARQIGCSKFHLCRSFKRETGMSMGRYVRRLRIAVAIARLRRGEGDLSALALDLGFASHSHFSAVFRRELGRTPSQVRAASFRHRSDPERVRT